MAPRTQYNRNLTIRLQLVDSLVDSFTFPIKPGEFQFDHPARMSTTQTLQGVYQDFGGLGVQKLTYQGHTGWRPLGANAPNDGFAVFQALYKQSYKQYHQLMQTADDPSQVKCLVIDDLYDTVYDVSLDDFQATKSKSTPLLYNYVLRMTVKSTQPNGRDPIDYLVQSKGVNATAGFVNDAILTASNYQSQQTRTYQTVSGDTFKTIAQQFAKTNSPVTPEQIAKANGYQNLNTNFTGGQVLIIP